ncbi:MAG: CinA family nicotinamide mononucleotide deamidase-related protein [Dehalococcoidales bacterium]|jgi:nicotinamide-nucleotide amidase|nr:CinA family nicotinamide mononucleotide deamidase-related protein [Dehalococcoidales bacterium]MDP7285865.1 CinA family nicotinamide mononucleotide deamidase-related protein [Dehalococcoidales bacterium]MDP7415992.1 CinA family nicotinamide mononucleotide deamidase-related protein [Dehalococcoidales bacterium]
MKAEILSIGTELLLGEIVDTNTPFLANQLSLLGIDLFFTSAVGDNPGRLSGALRQAWERSDVIITTGGLGPTQDDITRETIAGLFKEEPAVDPALKQSIVDYFAQRGIEMPASNIKQAVLVPSAAAIPNSRGTAPGWWVERDGRIIVAMPGPPGEMQFMWQNQVFPRLQRKTGAIILSRMLKTFSLTEAKVDELVTPLMSSPNPTLATYAKLDGIYLRIAAKAARRPEAEELISRHEADIKKILGDAIWGADDETQESVVGQLLTTRGLTLAVAESFTSGYLAHTLASAPGSRSYFKGGIVAATDEVKVVLGIDAGLVAGEPSAELAVAMASLARQKLGASIGIGIEGYSEPVGGTLPGTVFIAIDRESIDEPVVQRYSGRLYQMKKRAAYYALFDLMKLLRSA